uniref:FERM domain-containing protein n=1 Tax=Onchocerca flexuosa TaxID=387005 RepID=A0A183HDA2_9BILA
MKSGKIGYNFCKDLQMLKVLEEDYTNEILTEILYRSAKQEVLNGRYICDIDLSKKLAAL